MTTYQAISLLFAGLFLATSFIAIILLFFIGKTRIKEIDKAVLGYEFPHDNIFALMIRVPNYASSFLWEWSAKRTKLDGKIEHFDKKFRWPFIACFFTFLAKHYFSYQRHYNRQILYPFVTTR
jgi:hypothetical protein